MKKALTYLPLLLLCLACRKDPDAPGPSAKTDPVLPELCMQGLLQHSIPAAYSDSAYNYDECWGIVMDRKMRRYDYLEPVFNPLNSNQIAYLRKDNMNPGLYRELFTFDFCTGQAKLLASDAIGEPQWSTKGWLMFVGKDANIFKVDVNGGTPIQLTSTGGMLPSWSPDGTKIVYKFRNTSYKLIDDNGLVLDTINELTQLGTNGKKNWANDSIFTGAVYTGNINGPGYYDIRSNKFTRLDELNHEHTGENLTWSVHLLSGLRKVVWNTMASINTTENNTRRTLLDRKNATCWWLGKQMDLSPDKKYLIFDRTETEKEDECFRLMKTSLYIMNIDGTNERELVLP